MYSTVLKNPILVFQMLLRIIQIYKMVFWIESAACLWNIFEFTCISSIAFYFKCNTDIYIKCAKYFTFIFIPFSLAYINKMLKS